jgi:hypothetical protein
VTWRANRPIVGRADVHGRVGDRPAGPAEHRVELGVVVVLAEQDVVVRQSRCAPTNAE